MCRIFAFHSVLTSTVHSSLVESQGALSSLGESHPDGWGMAYFTESSPHLLKSTEPVHKDTIFNKLSAVVQSHTVIAHIRKATQGEISILNGHPFQYGKWIFCHNGNIKAFKEKRARLKALIHPKFIPHILGTTDSEILFYILLSQHYQKHGQELDLSIALALKKIVKIIGPLDKDQDAGPEETFLTFVITNGKDFYAFNGGQNIYYCTYKKDCPQKDSCSHFSKACLNKSSPGEPLTHLLFSSEKSSGDNVWNLMPYGALIGVNGSMQLFQRDLIDLFK